jgi:dTMP kinase
MRTANFANYLFPKNEYPGKLIVLDGMQRSGKSSAVKYLHAFLEQSGIPTVLTEWNSYPAIQPITDGKKGEGSFTPLSWFGLHYVDFILRYEETIRPALVAGKWVIADRYVYTAFSRDHLKGIDYDFIYNAYKFVVDPDIVFFFIAPPELVLQRHLLTTQDFHPYNSGVDIFGEEGDVYVTYCKYQACLREQYMLMKETYQAHIIDGEQPIEANANWVKEIVAQAFSVS